jgi:hypothetical protein
MRKIEPPNPSGICMCGCGELAPIATQNCRARSILKGDAARYISGHHGRKSSAPLCGYIVDESSGCWNWALHLTKDGYGRTRVNSKNKLAHVREWELKNGAVPDGFQIDHLCKNKACVNPDHLEVVTSAVNCQRRPKTKASAEIVLAIKASTESGAALGRKYNISRSQINKIRRSESWRNIEK